MISIVVHESQYPESIQAELLASLRRRQLNHKFLYDSPSQTKKWLALHQAYSPSRTEPGCKSAYDEAFIAVANAVGAPAVELISLGCGGGRKDARLLHLLSTRGATASYIPVDVSASMVLEAWQTVSKSSLPLRCTPVVCDLGQIACFAELIESARTQTASGIHSTPAGAANDTAHDAPVSLVTFFGMIPNFEPTIIMPALSSLLKNRNDLLLFSANLAPGADYLEGVNKIMPLYNNSLMRDWLMGFLSEIGVSASDGVLDFVIEPDRRNNLLRIAAYFMFHRRVQVPIHDDTVDFEAGSRLRVFLSYRHTCDSVKNLLNAYNLTVTRNWLAPSGEEGVFLVQKRD